MKSRKVILLMCAMAFIISLCGCGSEQKDTESKSTPDPKTTPEYHFTEAIQERGVLTVGAAANSSVDYIIPDDKEKYGDLAGTRDGYVPEICRRIAEEMDVRMEYVEYKAVEDLLDAAASGDVDIAAGAFVITEERLDAYEMTDRFDVVDEPGAAVYLSTDPGSGAMIQSEEELAHAIIAAVKGSVQAENTQIQYPEAEMSLLAGNEEVLEALASGQADACVFTSYTDAFADEIIQAIREGTIAQCDYEIEDPDYLGYGLILMKGNSELRQYINKLTSELMESGWLVECYKTEEIEAVERGILSPEAMRF